MSSTTQMTGRIKIRPSAMIACEECGREFLRNRKADLQRHMRIHTNEKPYACEYPGCEKAFRQSSALKNHQNFHTKEKPYKCDLCDQTFFDKPTCNRHRKEKHELSHVYKCSCEKLFKRKSVFKAHLREKHHHEPSEAQLASFRVSADCYPKASGSSRSSHSGHTTLPKLADALQNVRPPYMPPFTPNNSYYSSNPASYAAGVQNPVLLRNPYGQQPTSSRSGYGRYSTSGPNGLWIPEAQTAMYPHPSQVMAASGHPGAFLGIGPGSSTANYSPPSSSYSMSPSSSFASSSGSSSGSMGSYSPNSSFDRSASTSPVVSQSELIGGPSYILKPATDYSVNSYLLTGAPYV